MNDRPPGARYLYNVKSGELTKLAESAVVEGGATRAEKPIQYKSRDGLTIHGYLTLPLGRDPKNLPVVVNRTVAHGIATSGDRIGSAILANRGLRGFPDEFPGSTGYAASSGNHRSSNGARRAGRYHRRSAMVIKEGIADPKRVAMYGGS